MTRNSWRLAVCVAGLAVFAIPAGAARAETVLKAVAAFPKTNPQTISFLKFVDGLNAGAKGVLRIDYIGGPEVTPAAKQPIALRNGLFELLFGPPAYYLGIFPEGDAMDGMKTPPESRAVHGFDMIDKAARKKLGATFLGRFNFGLGLHVFLKNKPELTPDGDVKLHGLKIRSSGSYLDFLKALGATPVAMPPTEVYAALERGVVDGTAGSIADALTNGLHKFVKYRIDPPFSKGVVILIGNAKAIDAMPADARKMLREAAIRWETISMDAQVAKQRKFAEQLAALGETTIALKGAAAARYIATYQDGVWARVKEQPVDLDIAKAEAAFR